MHRNQNSVKKTHTYFISNHLSINIKLIVNIRLASYFCQKNQKSELKKLNVSLRHLTEQQQSIWKCLTYVSISTTLKAENERITECSKKLSNSLEFG